MYTAYHAPASVIFQAEILLHEGRRIAKIEAFIAESDRKHAAAVAKMGGRRG